jgi:hypothetical protein
MTEVGLSVIHKDLIGLTKEVRELKSLLKEPELREDVIVRINRARTRIKKEHVSHDEMLKEFVE